MSTIALCSVSFFSGYLLRGLTLSESENTTTIKVKTTLFAGMTHVDREEFAEAFDVGIPLDDDSDDNRRVLLLYSDDGALPLEADKKLSVADATENCDILKLILTEPHKERQCVALMGQWDSFDVYKWMRVPLTGGGLDKHVPLRHVARMHEHDGTHLSYSSNASKYDTEILMAYLSTLNTVLADLKPLVQKVARNNTVIVLVCNYGHSELLINFYCSAASRGFDLGQVLVFCTDVQTKALAEGLGLVAFYDRANYANMPKEAAQEYRDDTFGNIMMAKVFSVHMINLLGYDLLFQDVDVIWYRDPLTYVYNPEYDMVFQDDGSRETRYAPYSPNTGFYFVRHNERTTNFLHSLVMAGNLIVQSKSHQSVLTEIMSQHVSWRGLRVKVVSREGQDFPSGYHYHRRYEFMRKIIQGKIKPYIFHMNWTKSKKSKVLFLKQMGYWFVKEQCIGKAAEEIAAAHGDLHTSCCARDALISCHYRDKPSKLPCKESPPWHKGSPSFW
jgi:hypothetical protein